MLSLRQRLFAILSVGLLDVPLARDPSQCQAEQALQLDGAAREEAAVRLLQLGAREASSLGGQRRQVHASKRRASALRDPADTCTSRELTYSELINNVTWLHGDAGREQVLSYFSETEPVCFMPESRIVPSEGASFSGESQSPETLSPACYQCLANFNGAWSSQDSWWPAESCGCAGTWTESLEVLRRDKRQLKILFLGDSHIRQLMLRIIALLRGQPQPWDHFFECHAAYTIDRSSRRDMLRTCTLEPFHADSQLTFYFYRATDYNEIDFAEVTALAPDAVFTLVSWTVLDEPGIMTMQSIFRNLTDGMGSRNYWLTVPRGDQRNVRFNTLLLQHNLEDGGAQVLDVARVFNASPTSVCQEDLDRNFPGHKMCGVEPELRDSQQAASSLSTFPSVKGWRTSLGRYVCEDFDDLVQARAALALFFSDVEAQGGLRRKGSPGAAVRGGQPRLKTSSKIGSAPPGSVHADRTGTGTRCRASSVALLACVALLFALVAAILSFLFLSEGGTERRDALEETSGNSVALVDWRAFDGIKVFLTMAIVASHAGASAEWLRKFDADVRSPPFLATFWAWCGHPAMTVFFVMSGVLARHTMRGTDALMTPQAKLAYVRRRLLRLMPAYYASVLFYLPLAAKSHSRPMMLAWFLQFSGLQSWFVGAEACGVDLIWNFNGPAWFVSSLIPCFLAFALLAQPLRRLGPLAALGLIAGCCVLRSAPAALHAWTGFPRPADIGGGVVWGFRGVETWYEFPPLRLLEFLAGALLAQALDAPQGAGRGEPTLGLPSALRALLGDGCLAALGVQFAFGRPWIRITWFDGVYLLLVVVFFFCAATPEKAATYSQGVGFGVRFLRHPAWKPLAPLMYYSYLFQDCACSLVRYAGYSSEGSPCVFLATVSFLVVASAVAVQPYFEVLATGAGYK